MVLCLSVAAECGGNSHAVYEGTVKLLRGVWGLVGIALLEQHNSCFIKKGHYTDCEKKIQYYSLLLFYNKYFT